MRRILLIGMAISVLTAGVGCGDNEPTSCTNSGTCESGACVPDATGSRTCAPECVADTDCAAGDVCGIGISGQGFCAPSCDHDDLNTISAIGSFGCEAGRPTHSDFLTTPDCRLNPALCGSGEYCCEAPGERGCGSVAVCEARLPIGADCDRDEHCLGAGGCGVAASGGHARCLVEFGAVCTDDNCGWCRAGAPGYYVCTTPCDVDDDCPYPSRTCLGYYCSPATCNLSDPCPIGWECPAFSSLRWWCTL